MPNLNKTALDPDSGQLYLCATPIGNLEDITLRVLRVLKEVDLIAAEDTRRTLKLLNHYAIRKPLTSYHAHNQRQKGPWLIAQILQGKKVALVSDAGMPGVSDPGEGLVQDALAAGVPVTVLPGPSAVLAALTLSGLSTRRFVFEGFLPHPRKERKQRVQALAKEARTLVFFESPHRLLDTLSLLLTVWGPRKAAVARELTKKFETVTRGTLAEIYAHFQEKAPRGEFVLVIEGQVALTPAQLGNAPGQIAELLALVAARVEKGENPREVIKEVARHYQVRRRELYQAWISTYKAKGEEGPTPSET